MRRAFSMMTALFVIVLMAAVAAFVFSLAGKIVQNTTAQYQREQAMLLAKSYTEYAIMTVSANGRNGANNCLQTIQKNAAPNDPYSVTVEISYIGEQNQLQTCQNDHIIHSDTTASDIPLWIVVDTYVSYPAPDEVNNRTVTYHRRTLQKI